MSKKCKNDKSAAASNNISLKNLNKKTTEIKI